MAEFLDVNHSEKWKETAPKRILTELSVQWYQARLEKYCNFRQIFNNFIFISRKKSTKKRV